MFIQVQANVKHDANTQRVRTHFSAADESEVGRITWELHHYFGWDNQIVNGRPTNFRKTH